MRSGGEPTYYLADIAYHRDKLERSGGRLLDVLGADHHGYMLRLKAGLAALGHDPDLLEFSIMQLVHLVEGGERAQMSKRRGEFVTLDELLDDIGVDATRFFMLQRSHETTVDLDLELARTQSADNPVYYVQYAHARIASILRKAGEDAVAAAEAAQPRRVDAARAGRARPHAPPAGADRGGRGGGRAPSARTGSAPTRRRRPPTSTPSTATARSSAPPARESRRSGSASAC